MEDRALGSAQDDLSSLVENMESFKVGNVDAFKSRSVDFKSLKPKEEMQKRRDRMLRKQKDSRRDLTQQARNLALEEPSYLYAETTQGDEGEKEKETEDNGPEPPDMPAEERQKSKRKREEVEEKPPSFLGKFHQTNSRVLLNLLLITFTMQPKYNNNTRTYFMVTP